MVSYREDSARRIIKVVVNGQTKGKIRRDGLGGYEFVEGLALHASMKARSVRELKQEIETKFR